MACFAAGNPAWEAQSSLASNGLLGDAACVDVDDAESPGHWYTGVNGIGVIVVAAELLRFNWPSAVGRCGLDEGTGGGAPPPSADGASPSSSKASLKTAYLSVTSAAGLGGLDGSMGGGRDCSPSVREVSSTVLSGCCSFIALVAPLRALGTGGALLDGRALASGSLSVMKSFGLGAAGFSSGD